MMITMMTSMRMMLILLTMRGAIMTGCLEPNLYQSQRESRWLPSGLLGILFSAWECIMMPQNAIHCRMYRDTMHNGFGVQCIGCVDNNRPITDTSWSLSLICPVPIFLSHDNHHNLSLSWQSSQSFSSWDNHHNLSLSSAYLSLSWHSSHSQAPCFMIRNKWHKYNLSIVFCWRRKWYFHWKESWDEILRLGQKGRIWFKSPSEAFHSAGRMQKEQSGWWSHHFPVITPSPLTGKWF